MRFSHPEVVWALLLVPAMLLLLIWSARRGQTALHDVVGEGVRERLTRSLDPTARSWRRALSVIGTMLVTIALLGPQFGLQLSMAQRRGVDVVICLDLSRSMLAQDIRPNRLEHARYAIGELVDGLGSDRVSLVVYAAHAFVQCPLTLDKGALRLLLGSVSAGDLPSQGTSLERALETAASAFDPDDRQHKVIVVFSDGEDHVGDGAAVAARLAAEGVRIFTVGVGTAAGELIPTDGDQARDYHKDRAGNYVKTRLDEAALRAISRAGEGAHLSSTLEGSELIALQERIDRLDDKEFGEESFRRYEERYQWPLGLALICFLVEMTMSERQRQRRQWQGRFA
ncbi:MAG: VWA domain-containing protein [Gemmatimonadetes bacterium]|jgi:Ca-activated chloride channel homolog|nr:VWA domain-containing protein [Gemmatimonadota bacterium]